MQEIIQYFFSGITNGAIYAVIAIGFSMLYRSTDLINFGHGEFVMLGALPDGPGISGAAGHFTGRLRRRHRRSAF